MKKFILILLSVLCINEQSIKAADTISIKDKFQFLLHPDLSGINSLTLYSQIEGDIDSNLIFNEIYSPKLLEALGKLDVGNLRFPGGTIANFYHFNGEKGYGGDPYELDCRAGLINNEDMKARLSPDANLSKNVIVPFVELVNGLSNSYQRDVSVNYVVNLMTHIFYGDFFRYNVTIENEILTNGAAIQSTLALPVKDLTSADFPPLLQLISDVMSSGDIISIKDSLLADPGFVGRLNENMDGIQFLIDQGASIRGIELGNELYGQIMLFDDDLSDYGFDCTTPVEEIDSANAVTKTKNAVEAIVKYTILGSVYDEMITQTFNLPCAVLTAPQGKAIDFVNDKPVLIVNSPANYNLEKIWNPWFMSQDYPDAFVTHLYMQSFSDCSVYPTVPFETAFNFGNKIIDFYINTKIEDEFTELENRNINNKPYWITEWNMNNPTVLANTFLHASYLRKFSLKIMELNEIYNSRIETMNYHSLAAQNFNKYSLLQSGYNGTTTFSVDSQLMYYSFDHFSELMAKEVRPINAAFEPLLNPLAPDTFLIDIATFKDSVNNEVYLYHLNMTEIPYSIDLQNLTMLDNENNSDVYKSVDSFSTSHLIADIWYATNDGCPAYLDAGNFPNYYTSTVVIDSAGILNLPAYSQGISKLSLSEILICDDNNPCTIDQLVDGVCTHTPIVCDDGDDCTSDACVNGQCVFTSIVCDDGDPNTTDQCANGICVFTPITCDDNNPCTIDQLVDGVCIHTPIVCDDGDDCTTDACVNGQCVFTPIVCDDGDPNTTDQCVNGICVFTPITCDDNNPCTIDQLVDGVCTHTPIVCDDGDDCTTDACLNGQCVFTSIVCDDGDPNTTDQCVNGICVFTPITCDDNNPCTIDQLVDGVCTHTPIVCDDGDDCTTDACVSGQCVFTSIVCDDGDPNTTDQCVNGICVFTPITCDDNNPCTIDQLVDGVCTHTPIVCDDGDDCTTDACVSGQCVFTSIVCDDGDPNTTDQCVNGICVFTPITCDDNNPCTIDQLVDGVCTHTPIVCDDGDDCTSDACVNGQCVFTSIVCDDGDPNTTDQCVNGICVFTPITCDDNNPCTIDQLVDGVCTHTPIVCDDGDDCTNDACNTGVCTHTPIGQEPIFTPVEGAVCTTDDSIDLSILANPEGGSFSGPGVSGNYFNPGIAGSGVHTLTYSLSFGSNCIYEVDQDVTVSVCTGIESLTSFDGLYIYPNPSNNVFYINYVLNRHSKIYITLFDSQSRELMILVDSEISKGNHLIEVPTFSLASGTYLIRLESDNESVMKKILILR